MNKFLVLSLLLSGIATASAVDQVLGCKKNETTNDYPVVWEYEKGFPVDKENITDWNKIKKDSGLAHFQLKYSSGMGSGYMQVDEAYACRM